MRKRPPILDLKAEPEPERQNYYLVAGEIVFTHIQDPNQQPQAIRANSVVMSSDGLFAVPQIGRAQQALQQNFFARMDGGKEIKILDVVIMNLIPLGRFTKEEFNVQPTPIVEPLSAEPVTELQVAATEAPASTAEATIH